MTHCHPWRSCSRWWCPQTNVRLAKSVNPPCSQRCTWWASVQDGGASQPGKEQPPSLAANALRWWGGGVASHSPVADDTAAVTQYDGDDLGLIGQDQRVGDGDRLAVPGGGGACAGGELLGGHGDDQDGGDTTVVGQAAGGQQPLTGVLQRVMHPLRVTARVLNHLDGCSGRVVTGATVCRGAAGGGGAG